MNSLPIRFPNPREAPADAPLALGGDLTVATLLHAYTQGIFPWYSSKYPVLWWCPDPRFVLSLESFKMPGSLARKLKQMPYSITADTAFPEVIQACAQTPRPGQNGTWITSSMLKAYTELHHAGYAHSIEVWHENELVGGLYGIALGRVFFGESMFHFRPEASKAALVGLVRFLKSQNYSLIDCQQPTEHLERFGAVCWPRDQFLDHLAASLNSTTTPGKWSHHRFSTHANDRP